MVAECFTLKHFSTFKFSRQASQAYLQLLLLLRLLYIGYSNSIPLEQPLFKSTAIDKTFDGDFGQQDGTISEGAELGRDKELESLLIKGSDEK